MLQLVVQRVVKCKHRVEEFHSALRMVTVLLIINTSTAKHVAFVDHSGDGLLDVF